jgi:hypothetical protein
MGKNNQGKIGGVRVKILTCFLLVLIIQTFIFKKSYIRHGEELDYCIRQISVSTSASATVINPAVRNN